MLVTLAHGAFELNIHNPGRERAVLVFPGLYYGAPSYGLGRMIGEHFDATVLYVSLVEGLVSADELLECFPEALEKQQAKHLGIVGPPIGGSIALHALDYCLNTQPSVLERLRFVIAIGSPVRALDFTQNFRTLLGTLATRTPQTLIPHLSVMATVRPDVRELLTEAPPDYVREGVANTARLLLDVLRRPWPQSADRRLGCPVYTLSCASDPWADENWHTALSAWATTLHGDLLGDAMLDSWRQNLEWNWPGICAFVSEHFPLLKKEDIWQPETPETPPAPTSQTLPHQQRTANP